MKLIINVSNVLVSSKNLFKYNISWLNFLNCITQFDIHNQSLNFSIMKKQNGQSAKQIVSMLLPNIKLKMKYGEEYKRD